MTANVCKFRLKSTTKKDRQVAAGYNMTISWAACWVHKLLEAEQLLQFYTGSFVTQFLAIISLKGEAPKLTGTHHFSKCSFWHPS